MIVGLMAFALGGLIAVLGLGVLAARREVERLLGRPLPASMLMLLILLGALVAVAGGRAFNASFTAAEDRPYIREMSAELRDLVSAQEEYFAAHASYATALGSLHYRVFAGTTVTIVTATGRGWSARANSNATSKTCGIFVGSAAPPSAAVGSVGEPACW